MNKKNTLPPDIKNIVIHRGTEPPHINPQHPVSTGTYLCRQCGLALFRATHQFEASCGWPSFDDSLTHTIQRIPDQDGKRTEIICDRCKAHLGHIFIGEKLTPKNERYCVNSLAIDFIQNPTVMDTEEAIYAGGCFWGIQYWFDTIAGVLKTEVGYIGGSDPSPTYPSVCQGNTGYLEAVRVLFDPSRTDYTTLTKFFLEIHDPTDLHGQGPDRGAQYHSAIFYLDPSQKEIAQKLLSLLEKKGFSVVTQIQEATIFWRGEETHQAYYQKHQKTPYCHFPVKRF